MQISQTVRPKSARKTLPSKQPRGASKIKPAVHQVEAAKSSKNSAKQPTPRTTKQELVLSLLSRKHGASVKDIMEATGWQMHSVRGFFAGTVKKKLGISLTTSKIEGEARRYCILARGGR